MGPQKLPLGVDEFTVAGLAGKPINVVTAKTVDLTVPAEAEIVIEGFIDTTKVEPEGPFGESHGHIALEEYNMPMRVTAITHRKCNYSLIYKSSCPERVKDKAGRI